MTSTLFVSFLCQLELLKCFLSDTSLLNSEAFLLIYSNIQRAGRDFNSMKTGIVAVFLMVTSASKTAWLLLVAL